MAARAILYVAVAGSAALVRSIGFPTVFSSIGVQLPYAGDAYYHLRRIVYTVARFPESLDFDAYVSFPHGSEIIWPPAFDGAIAASIRPFVDPLDRAAVEALAVWAPVVLGVLTACAVAALAERHYGRGAAWCAGLGYALLPIGFVYSQLGMIDHHVAIALATTGLLGLACESFARDDGAPTWRAALATRETGISAGLGLAMAATLLTWPGALLHVAILQLAFGARWLGSEDAERARVRAVGFALSQAIVAIALLPFGWGASWRELGDWSLLALSRFHPLYFACAAASIGAVQWTHERLGDDDRRRRVGLALGLPLLVVAAVLVLVAPLREAVVAASGWFSPDEILLELASEMRPLLAPHGRLDPGFAVSRLGAGILVLPFVWAALARCAWAERSATKGLLLFWGFALFALALRQWRFANSLAPIYAVLLGAAFAHWASTLPGRLRERRTRAIVEAAAVAGLVGWTALAWTDFYRPIVRTNAHAWRSEPARIRGPLIPPRRLFDRAGRWLARHTPATRGYLDPSSPPEYGVLASWTAGHLLRYRAERPMVIDNFGPYAGQENFDAARAYFAEGDEDAAIAILERLRVRYVIGSRDGAGVAADLRPSAMAHRLWLGYGSWMTTDANEIVPGLSRHRLLLYLEVPSPAPSADPDGPRPESLGVWQVVRGARIEGRTEPGARVHLALPLFTSSGLETAYRRTTVADARGAYRFVVPYPTDVRFSPDVTTRGGYRLAGPRGRARLEVEEAEIVRGGVVPGPSI